MGRDDIEESKRGVAMNAWPPQASYPCGNFSITTVLSSRGQVPNRHQRCRLGPAPKDRSAPVAWLWARANASIKPTLCPCAPHMISSHAEMTLGYLRYHLTGMPPQPNSPPVPCPGPCGVRRLHISPAPTAVRLGNPEGKPHGRPSRSGKLHSYGSSGVSSLPKLPLTLHLPCHKAGAG